VTDNQYNGPKKNLKQLVRWYFLFIFWPFLRRRRVFLSK